MKKIEREKIVLAALPELSLRIIEHALEHGRVTISDIVKVTSTSRNTLNNISASSSLKAISPFMAVDALP